MRALLRVGAIASSVEAHTLTINSSELTHDLVVYADFLFHYFLKSSILLLFSIGEIEVRVFFPVDL